MLIKMHHSVNWSRHVVIKLFISSSFLKKVGAASQMRARVYTELHWRPVTRRLQARLGPSCDMLVSSCGKTLPAAEARFISTSEIVFTLKKYI